MQFSVFAGYLQDFEAISSRLEITARLAELFGQLEKAEIPQACYLLQGQLLPPYHNLELQVSVKTVIKALGQILAETRTEPAGNQTLFGEPNLEAGTDEVETRYKSLGDLGHVAAEVVGVYRRQFTKARKIDPLSVHAVYTQLWNIALEGGKDSQQRKLTKFVGLLSTVDELSAKFIVRITLGRLRLGFSDQTIIDALSWAQTGGKGERDALELAYQKKADIGLLAQAYLAEKDVAARAKALQHYQVEVGVPVIPALCQRLNSAAEMIEKNGNSVR
jgi:DNA ligase-1